MAPVYNFSYSPDNVYGHVVALIREYVAATGVHVDIGCGYGAIAEHLRDEIGLTYLGFDLADDGLSSLRQRGFETHRIDLSNPAKVEAIVQSAVGHRKIASLTFIDTLEHIVNGAEVIAMLRRLAEPSSAPMILSVPNITHRDVALKSLSGRWDVTEAGILDHTHVEAYSDHRLSLLMGSSGWREIDKNDVTYEKSDQAFPSRVPTLDPTLPIGDFMHRLVEDANPHFIVNQFVRAYVVDEPKPISVLHDRTEPSGSQFAILMATREGSGQPNRRILEALERQTNQDFELVVAPYSPDGAAAGNEFAKSLPKQLAKKTLLVAAVAASRAEALNNALDRACGRHLIVLGEDDDLDQGWLATLSELGGEGPHAVLRVGARFGSREYASGVLPFDFGVVECPSAYAIPLGFFEHLGIRFDATSQPKEEAYVIARAILYCGVVAATRKLIAPRSESDDPPAADRRRVEGALFGRILDGIDAHAILLPRGSASKIAAKNNEALQTSESNAKAPSAFGNLKRSFVARYDELARRQPALEPQSPIGRLPFLSVIARTTGADAAILRRMLMALASQTSLDFELLISVQSSPGKALTGVVEILAEFPTSLRSLASVLKCDRPGRSAPLNDALWRVRGRYVAILDDDQVVLPHWVETFKKLSEESPQSMLRTSSARADNLSSGAPNTGIARAPSSPAMESPGRYDALGDFYSFSNPPVNIALPVECFTVLNLRWDEKRETSAEWEMAIHAAMNCGVVSSQENTSINGNQAAPSAPGAGDRERLIESFDAQPVLLPPGSVRGICELIDSNRRFEDELTARNELALRAKDDHVRHLENHVKEQHIEAQRRIAHLQEQVAQRDTELSALVGSTSWRITGPIRGVLGFCRRARERIRGER